MKCCQNWPLISFSLSFGRIMIYVKTSKLPGFFQAHQDATLFPSPLPHFTAVPFSHSRVVVWYLTEAFELKFFLFYT
jgi:hypothetical protein